jgi:hypothetical protein
MARKLTKARSDFVWFLENRLIPDLEESGKEFTAEDFQTCADLISEGRTDPEFARWLRTTLIPDLKESGAVYTAQDFQKCARFISPPKRRRALGRQTTLRVRRRRRKR